jgi:SAM-dependent methyltransferase
MNKEVFKHPSIEGLHHAEREMGLEEITHHRLGIAYSFFAEQLLPRFSKMVGRELDHLDEGVWRGDFVPLLMRSRAIRHLTGIDISEKRIMQTSERFDLIHDLQMERLRLSQMNAADLEGIPDDSVDSITAIDLMKHLRGATPQIVMNEGSRVLRRPGVMMLNFVDRSKASIMALDKFAPKAVGFTEEKIRNMAANAFGENIEIVMLGQAPFQTSEKGTLIPYRPAQHEGRVIVTRDAHQMQEMYDKDGNKNIDPLYIYPVIYAR